MAGAGAGSDMIRSMAVIDVADVTRSEAFYVEQLGFVSHGTFGEPPDFCIVQRGQVTLAMSRNRDPARPIPTNQYWAAYVYVTDVEALAEEYRRRGIELIRGPVDMDYGLRDFDVRDPDGHLICFGQDLEPGGKGPGLAE